MCAASPRVNPLKVLSFFFGLQRNNSNFNFFGLIRWFFKNSFFFHKSTFFFQNIILWLCIVSLLKKKKIIFLSHPALVATLSLCNTPALVVPSTVFKTCGGLFSNFTILKWFCFHYHIPIFFKLSEMVCFFDFVFPDHLLAELTQCRITSLGFFIQKKKQQLYPSIVFFYQIWFSKTSLISKNFFIFFQGLKRLSVNYQV